MKTLPDRWSLHDQRMRDGLCVVCGGPNDRKGELTKAHQPASKCTACLASANAAIAEKRREAENRRAETAAALGLSPNDAAEVTKRKRARIP